MDGGNSSGCFLWESDLSDSLLCAKITKDVEVKRLGHPEIEKREVEHVRRMFVRYRRHDAIAQKGADSPDAALSGKQHFD